MPPKVFFVPSGKDLISKIPELYDAVISRSIKGGQTVAVKLHFGEEGNTAFIKPQFVKPFVDRILAAHALPFLTDANTLYKGSRSDSLSHIETARKHGFSLETMGAQVIIADGADGRQSVKVPINLKHFKEASIAAAVIPADCLVAISHFKGHDCTGFGGAIKNVGMGLGSRPGKQLMHSDVDPEVDPNKCVGDGECVKWCPTSAITLAAGKAKIDKSKCIGCAECVAYCPVGAIAISWAGEPNSIQEKMAEYACAVLLNKRGRAFFFNFLVDISPNCDCYPFNDAPIASDIGILGSTDIVAIDQASFDLLNNAPGRIKGPDKFRTLYPDIDSELQIKYAQEIGLGSRRYELVRLKKEGG